MTLKSHLEKLHNYTKQHVSNGLSRIKTIKLGTISSFNPNTYAAKVQWQPFVDENGQISETGEAPIVVPNAGNLEGFLFPPRNGAQCVVGFVDGDMQQPVILGYMYSDEDRPILVTQGQLKIKLNNGGNSVTLFMKDDGTIEISSSQKINITAPEIALTGEGESPDRLVKYTEMKALYDNHVHENGGTGIPVIPMSDTQATTNTTAS